MSQIKNNNGNGVKFEGESYQAIKYYRETAPPKIIKGVMKYSGGLIKNEKYAEYIVFGFIILAVIVSLYLVFGRSLGGSKIPSLPPPTPFQESKF